MMGVDESKIMETLTDVLPNIGQKLRVALANYRNAKAVMEAFEDGRFNVG